MQLDNAAILSSEHKDTFSITAPTSKLSTHFIFFLSYISLYVSTQCCYKKYQNMLTKQLKNCIKNIPNVTYKRKQKSLNSFTHPQNCHLLDGSGWITPSTKTKNKCKTWVTVRTATRVHQYKLHASKCLQPITSWLIPPY